MVLLERAASRGADGTTLVVSSPHQVFHLINIAQFCLKSVFPRRITSQFEEGLMKDQFDQLSESNYGAISPTKISCSCIG